MRWVSSMRSRQRQRAARPGRSKAKHSDINGFTKSSLPWVRAVNRTSPKEPRTAAAIEPLTMLGRSGVWSWAWATASR
ncbi:hypothetical protein ADK93_03720 [Streptomyces sp. XY58]|nr:hypothetical protein ADK93_03720 [Streptomyces sp. XY58]KOV11785.1 hypothetical protein ADK89_03105 [Streptomyces sp. XY37]KOV54976.1 hypothetical protein ADK99_04240 [Streptomyces sp. MMG1064]